MELNNCEEDQFMFEYPTEETELNMFSTEEKRQNIKKLVKQFNGKLTKKSETEI